MTLSQHASLTIIDEVPSGGATGQVLSKASNADYDLIWANGGSGGGNPSAPSGSVQYNNSGSFGGFSSWDGTRLLMSGYIDMNVNPLINAKFISTATTDTIGIIYNGPIGETCYLGAPNGDGYSGLYDGGDGNIATADSSNNYKFCGDNMTFLNDQTWNIFGHYLANYNGDTCNNAGVTRAFINNGFQTSAIGFTTVKSTPNDFDRVYEVSGMLIIRIAASTSSILGGVDGVQIKYTYAGDGLVKTLTVPSTTSTQNTVGTAVPFSSGALFVKKNTAIQYSVAYTSVGGTAMQYDSNVLVKEF